jgi:hypothetical protein
MKVEVADKKSVERIGGFSFTSSPIIQKPSDNTSDLSQNKPQETVKPSPFASLSFAKPSYTNTSTTSDFTFGTPTISVNPTPIFDNKCKSCLHIICEYIYYTVHHDTINILQNILSYSEK